MSARKSLFFPFLHTLVELPVFPWYALEFTCIYLMPFLVLVLNNRICEVETHIRLLSSGIAAIVCLLACGYGFASSMLTVPIMRGFSKLVFLYKVAISIYLFVVSFHAVRTGNVQIWPLFYASIS